MNSRLEQELKQAKDIVIISPHYDDEVIGCFEIITNEKLKTTILYSSQDSSRRNEAAVLREYTNIKNQVVSPQTLPPNLIDRNIIYLIPDPHFEIHPLHRQWGNIGESMVRNRLNVIFYTTSMNTPYIREVEEPEKKKEILNRVYPSQADLWKFDHKYFLWEGYCKWVF